MLALHATHAKHASASRPRLGSPLSAFSPVKNPPLGLWQLWHVATMMNLDDERADAEGRQGPGRPVSSKLSTALGLTVGCGGFSACMLLLGALICLGSALNGTFSGERYLASPYRFPPPSPIALKGLSLLKSFMS